jgi:hypothetical protein
LVVERENYVGTDLGHQKGLDIFVKWFHLMREVHIRCFFSPLKFMKKHVRARVDFLFQIDFGFFNTMDRFIMVYKIFSVF